MLIQVRRRWQGGRKFTLAASLFSLVVAASPTLVAQTAPATSPAPAPAPATSAPAPAAAPAAAAPNTTTAANAAEAAATTDANVNPVEPTTATTGGEATATLNPLPEATEPSDGTKTDEGKEAKVPDAPAGSEPTALEFSSGDLTLGFGVRVIGGWEYEVTKLTDAEEMRGTRPDEFGFFLNQARFTVDGSWGKALSLQLDLDFTSSDPVRDAWLNYKISRPFQVRVGQFKRPFSRLELMGAGKLPLRSRGLANDQIVGELGYGGRSLGTELWGRFKKQGVHWSVSASNPPPGVAGVDLHARLAYEPTDWLEVGAGGVHKIVENRATIPEDFIAGNGFGVDLDIHAGATHVLLDALVGENLGLSIAQPDPLAIRNNAGSFGGYVSHDLSISKRWALQPLLFGEWVDSNLEYSKSEAIRAVGGLNALWNKNALRIMPQLELIRPLRTGPVWVESTTFYVLASAQL